MHAKGEGLLRFQYEFPDNHTASAMNMDNVPAPAPHETAAATAGQGTHLNNAPFIPNHLETQIDPVIRYEVLQSPASGHMHDNLWLAEHQESDELYILHQFIHDAQISGYPIHDGESVGGYMRRMLAFHNAHAGEGTAQPMMNPANPSQISGFQINGKPDEVAVWQQAHPREFSWLRQQGFFNFE